VEAPVGARGERCDSAGRGSRIRRLSAGPKTPVWQPPGVKRRSKYRRTELQPAQERKTQGRPCFAAAASIGKASSDRQATARIPCLASESRQRSGLLAGRMRAEQLLPRAAGISANHCATPKHKPASEFETPSPYPEKPVFTDSHLTLSNVTSLMSPPSSGLTVKSSSRSTTTVLPPSTSLSARSAAAPVPATGSSLHDPNLWQDTPCRLRQTVTFRGGSPSRLHLQRLPDRLETPEPFFCC